MLKFLSFIKHQRFLAAILLIALILRMWRFWEFDYVHDELSALTRMNYSSWKDFFHYGIKMDGHPAGVHLFLKFLYSVFGDSPFFIRLPFIVFSLLCVYQVFKVGKELFSESVGLLSAAFLSIGQYAIFFGVIARPYSPGLLVSILLLRVWIALFIYKRTTLKLFIVYGILLALLGYIHYFALLFGIILSFMGLFWIQKKDVVKYLITGGLAFTLYIPHMDIFLYQLNVGGLNWLNKPNRYFIVDYLMYIFNHSFILFGKVFLGSLYFIWIKKRKFKIQHLQKRTLLFFLFFLPFLIGFLYSFYFAPVLQFSALIFGFPCFIVFVFSFWGESKNYLFPLIAIFLLGISSLVYQRNHLDWFLANSTEKFFEFCAKEKSLNVGRHEYEFANFYKDRFNHEFEYHSLDRDCTTIMDFQTLLSSSKSSKLVLGDVYQEEVGLAYQYYPYLLYEDQGNGYEHYILSRSCKDCEDLYYLKKDLLKEIGVEPNYVLSNTYDLQFSFKYDTLIRKSHDIIDFFIEVELDSSDMNELVLVTEVKKGENQLKWIGSNSKQQRPPEYSKISLVNSYSIPWDLDTLNDLSMTSYIWNPHNKHCKILKYGYGIRKGNKNRYSAFKKLRY